MKKTLTRNAGKTENEREREVFRRNRRKLRREAVALVKEQAVARVSSKRSS